MAVYTVPTCTQLSTAVAGISFGSRVITSGAGADARSLVQMAVVTARFLSICISSGSQVPALGTPAMLRTVLAR